MIGAQVLAPSSAVSQDAHRLEAVSEAEELFLKSGHASVVCRHPDSDDRSLKCLPPFWPLKQTLSFRTILDLQKSLRNTTECSYISCILFFLLNYYITMTSIAISKIHCYWLNYYYQLNSSPYLYFLSFHLQNSIWDTTSHLVIMSPWPPLSYGRMSTHCLFFNDLEILD